MPWFCQSILKKGGPGSLIIEVLKYPIDYNTSTCQRHVVTISIIHANRGTKEPNLNAAAPRDPVTDKHELDIW